MTTERTQAGELSASDAKRYQLAIQRTAGMVRDKSVKRLAAAHGLDVLDVTWEDTGRFKGSAVGPNISDMTIQVQHKPPGSDRPELTCMPVIRLPNFSDVTGDISPDLFFVLVGNEKGNPLRKITLRELLGNLREHLTKPASWKGDRASLLAPDRDRHVLVSAQACFLPVPLKQKEPMRFRGGMLMEDTGVVYCCASAPASDLEEAVIGHGEVEGPFAEIDGLEIERDDRYPVRVTVQFYKATSNGVVAPEDMAEITGQIQRVYREADYVGSLVLEESHRLTEHGGPKFEPPDWWERFWERHFANTGQTPEEAIHMLEKLLGRSVSRATQADAEAALEKSEEAREG